MTFQVARAIGLLSAFIFVVACGAGQSPTVPSSAQTTPATFSVTGVVKQTAPTLTALSDVRVEILDGSAAGRTVNTGADGRYSFDGLRGGMSIRVSKPGYLAETKGVEVTKASSLDFDLAPEPRHISESFQRVFRDNVGDGKCTASGRPCFRIQWPVHHDGRVDVGAVWADYTHNALFSGLNADWVSVQLFRGASSLAYDSTDAKVFPRNDDTEARFAVDVTKGSLYELEIAYFSYNWSRRTVTVNLATARPN